MELQQLRYFQTVARLENITRAAEELHISQPSLSITIARLEDDIGAPLFDRPGRKIQLNKLGAIFLKKVERAFAELEEGKRQIADLVGHEHGTVLLASTNPSLLPDLLTSFLSNHPRIKFRLFQAPISGMQNQLETGIDFCISSPLIEGRGISGVPLIHEEIVLIVPNGHRLAQQKSIQLHEVADESFISLKSGYGLRDSTDMFCRQAGFIPDVSFEVDEPSLTYNLVKAGLGIAFFPLNALKRINDLTVVGLHIDEPSCYRTVGLSWLKDRYMSTAARAFGKFVVDYFKRL